MDLLDLIVLLVALPIALLFAGLITVVLGVVLLVLVCCIALVMVWAFLQLLQLLFVSRGDSHAGP